MRRWLTSRLRTFTAVVALLAVATATDRAAASGAPDEEALRLFLGAPVLVFLGGTGSAVAVSNFQRNSITSGAWPALGFGLGALNLGLAAGYVAAMRDGGGPATMALLAGHGIAGSLCVASSVRLLTLPRVGGAVVGPVAIVRGNEAVPALGVSGRW
jgi:peptidoglycan/LPS O-acetylase OafA/YrhL